MNHNFTVIRSSRKTLSLQITPEGQLLIRAPSRLPQREIDRFVEKSRSGFKRRFKRCALPNRRGRLRP